MLVARPSPSAPIRTAFSHGSSSEVSKRTLRQREEALQRQLALHADHAAARAGHPDVGHVCRAARQHARVGRRHVGVRPDARGHAPVEVPAHRDLLAGRLRVHVDEHGVGSVAQLGERGIRVRERRADGLQVHEAGQVDHAQAHAVPLDHGVPAARASLRVVRGPHDPLLAIQQVVHLAVPERVVAERDRVGPHLEQLARRLLRDPHAAGGVLPVHHHEVRLVRSTDLRQQRGERPASDAADHIADEEKLHCRRFCQPALGGDGDRNARGARPRQALRR